VRTAGVKLGAASVAPSGQVLVIHMSPGAVTYTCPGSGLSASRQEGALVPLRGSPFQTSPPRTRMRDGHTRGAEQIASGGARYAVTQVQGDQVPEDRVPAKCANGARIRVRIVDEDPALAGKVSRG
jgi:hypothetical protein